MRFGLALLVSSLAACAMPDDADFEPADYEPVAEDAKADGVPNLFNRHYILDDALFTNEDGLSVAELQAFFEDNAYGTRSWLADYKVGQKTIAQALVDTAVAHKINPMVLLVRMQVEKSLVSKTSAPTQKSLDYAFGCGCPDGKACDPEYKGIDKQLSCAADRLVTHYNASVDESGQWEKGVARKTLDPISVTPVNHITAASYAYTPWVLEKKGGNWLVWNVIRKYQAHIEAVRDLQ